MKLQTNIPLSKQPHNQIDYHSKLLLLGSCFVENIGEKLSYFKFQSTINPLGILFHPLAIEKLIEKSINLKKYTEEDIFYVNERWHCFDAHSHISNSNKDVFLEDLNNAIKLTNKQILQSTHIIITLGTAWVYRHKETDTIVANCHKVPQKKFSKELLLVDEVEASLQKLIALIKSVNPRVSILFTVSPVRHIKDGFEENMQSKAHLFSALHQVIEPRKQVYYFPSYEIMMDELRDYRFYKEDMVHPNAIAINYIWNKFVDVWFSNNCSATMKSVAVIQKGLQHKPFNEASKEHEAFLLHLQTQIKELQKDYSFIKFN